MPNYLDPFDRITQIEPLRGMVARNSADDDAGGLQWDAINSAWVTRQPITDAVWGNIDWRGDVDTGALTWAGPVSRHAPITHAGNVGSPITPPEGYLGYFQHSDGLYYQHAWSDKIYIYGRVLAEAPDLVLGAALRSWGGKLYLLAVCGGVGDTDQLYSMQLIDAGPWVLVGNIDYTGIPETVEPRISPWFFNRDGTKAAAVVVYNLADEAHASPTVEVACVVRANITSPVALGAVSITKPTIGSKVTDTSSSQTAVPSHYEQEYSYTITHQSEVIAVEFDSSNAEAVCTRTGSSVETNAYTVDCPGLQTTTLITKNNPSSLTFPWVTLSNTFSSTENITGEQPAGEPLPPALGSHSLSASSTTHRILYMNLRDQVVISEYMVYTGSESGTYDDPIATSSNTAYVLRVNNVDLATLTTIVSAGAYAWPGAGPGGTCSTFDGASTYLNTETFFQPASVLEHAVGPWPGNLPSSFVNDQQGNLMLTYHVDFGEGDIATNHLTGSSVSAELSGFGDDEVRDCGVV